MKKLILMITILSTSIVSAQEKNDIDKFLQEKDSLTQLNIGKPYPNFTITTLKNTVITEKDLVGKVTLINFWFQYCAPCIAEFETLNDIYREFKDNKAFQFFSFTRDYSEEARKTVQKYLLPYTVCSLEDQECYRLNLNSGFPTTILVDKKGEIVYLKNGGALDKELIKKDFYVIEQKIQELLDEKESFKLK